jgi:ABC-2 type transport system permease protein
MKAKPARWDKISAILRKEWSEVFKNRLVLFTVAFLPLILTALPLVALYAMNSSAGMPGLTASDMPPGFEALCGKMSGGACAQYFVVSQFMLLFMLLPLSIPVTIAAYSIVGEKTTRTLEPLLATPVSTAELLAGKGLAAALPAIGLTWLAFGIFALGVRLLTRSTEIIARLGDPLWLLAIFVVGPLLAWAAVCAAVMVSSRTSDPRVAEQISMLVILPLLAVFFGQITGFILINAQTILWLAVILAIVDAGLLAFAVRLFEREAILTRWR